VLVKNTHDTSLRAKAKQSRNSRHSELVSESNYISPKLVLGSATPSLVDYFLAAKKSAVVELPVPARASARKPRITLVDMTRPENRGKHVSPLMIRKIKDTLAAHAQVLVFHNRRGTASLSLCESCGWTAVCPWCFVPLTLHGDKFELRCHICGHREKAPTKCPECGSTDVVYKGLGTKALEEELGRLFPDATIARFDGDTKKGRRVADLYQSLYDGKIDIIIGTQTIAKGLDLPRLRLVAIPGADAGLNLPDFAAGERTFQLISQAVGRVGRGDAPTEVIVQSFSPNSPVIRSAVAQDYAGFYAAELERRRAGHFPPFAHLLKITCSYKTEKAAIFNATKFKNAIEKSVIPGSTRNPANNITILGPAPAFYERLRDQYRWQLVVRSGSRETLKSIADKIPPTHFSAELDPNSLL
jgi:primosomal protein N' (replication factor Y)